MTSGAGHMAQMSRCIVESGQCEIGRGFDSEFGSTAPDNSMKCWRQCIHTDSEVLAPVRSPDF